MIFAFINQKGGVGKTTLALHLAAKLSLDKNRVLLVDGDPQGSARDWSVSRDKSNDPLFPVVAMDRPVIHKELPELASHYDHTVIDGPPRITDLARSAIFAADSIIIPVQPSPYDVWACREVVELLSEAVVYKENIKSFFVVNRKIANTSIGRDVYDALSEYNIPVLQASITQRVAYAESGASGRTVMETEPDGLASKEINSLADEIMEVSR